MYKSGRDERYYMASDHDLSFDVRFGDDAGTLLAGFAEYGLAGLTAADYLTTELGLEQTGHIAVEGLPAITPFENGTPRRHTRLFSKPEFDFTILVGELAIPPFAARPFADGTTAQVEESGIEEIVVLSGVPIAHGPDDHRPFYIATEGYQKRRLEETDITPMTGGFLEGINAELLDLALETGVPTCLLTTPVHARTPDVEASLRLLEAVDRIYDIDFDIHPLETFAEDISRQYEELAARIEATRKEHVADDRMYM